MAKTLCKWTEKTIQENHDSLSKIIKGPRYFCRNCARAARKRKYLCKPHPLPD